MKIRQLIEAATTTFGKQGGKTVRKYKCTTGPRKGRLVAKASTCTAPISIKKSNTLKKTRRSKGSIVSVKRQRTKRTNAASIRAGKYNRTRTKPRTRNSSKRKRT